MRHTPEGNTTEFRTWVRANYAPPSSAAAEALAPTSDRGDPGPERLRSALIEVAEAVGPGGEAVRLPFRPGEIPASLPRLAEADAVGVVQSPGGAAAYVPVAHVQVQVNGRSLWSSSPPLMR